MTKPTQTPKAFELRWLALPERLSMQVAAYQKATGMKTKSHAVRALVDKGLAALAAGSRKPPEHT